MIIDPSLQNNLYGHEAIFNNLFHLYRNNKLPNKILLSGDKGVGKSTLSYHLINCILSFPHRKKREIVLFWVSC